MSQKAIYPGTFDPITKGHIDLVERACKLFDKVVLAIAASEAKSPLFTLEERIDISKRIFKGNDQVEIIGFSGLLVDLAKDNDATILIRGLRVVADFEYEFQLANMNRAMEGACLFLKDLRSTCVHPARVPDRRPWPRIPAVLFRALIFLRAS